MANEVIKVYSTKAYAITNGTTGRIDPVEAITGHNGIISNSETGLPYHIYKKYYYRIEANEPVSEFHIDWDDGEDNSSKKANIEIITLDTPSVSTITSHIYTEHKHFFPLIRTKNMDGFLSKWYTNDSTLNDYSDLEESTLSAGQNEFSTVSEEKADSDRINSFLPSNLPPVGILKTDKKHIYSGIDNDSISGNYPLVYAYSTSTASAKPDITLTLQDSKGAVKKHTIAAANIWNAGSAWVSEVLDGDTASSNTYTSAVPKGNTHTINHEKWRLSALHAFNSGSLAVRKARIAWTSASGTDNKYLIMTYAADDVYDNRKCIVYFTDGIGGSRDLGEGKDPSGGNHGIADASSLEVEISEAVETDSILNDLKVVIENAAHGGAGGLQLPLSLGSVVYAGSGLGHYIDLEGTAVGDAGADWSFNNIDATYFTLTNQRRGDPVTTLTESAKNLLRVELDNATELADDDRIYIKSFDPDPNGNGTISEDAVITNSTVAVLSNGSPIVDLEDRNTIFLDGTESFTRASNLSISSYNFDIDKLNHMGGWTIYTQATDADGVSDLMATGLGFSSTGSKELSYSFDNNSHTLDSDSRFYPMHRLVRLQVKDSMTDSTTATARDALTYSAIEHFAHNTYTGNTIYQPSDLESRGLLLFSHRDIDSVAALWDNVSSRNLNDTQEIMGSATGGAEGTYALNNSTYLTDHPRNHLFLCQTDKFDRIFFRMDNNNSAGDSMPTIAITAYYANGLTWAPLEIIDNTQGLKTSGSIKFSMPHDWNKGVYTDIDDGNWDGPVEETDAADSEGPKQLWTSGNFPNGAYGLIISFSVLSSSNNHRNLKCMNVWPYNNSHSQLIKIEDSHYVSLNSIAIAQSISFGRSSKIISIEDKFGKSDIRKIGAAGGAVRFGGIDLGGSDDDRKTIVGYQKNATPVYLDIEHRSGEKTRFYGVISQVSEDHPAGRMIPKWAVTMNIAHVLELSSTGIINSDKIPIGGALVDDGKYIL